MTDYTTYERNRMFGPETCMLGDRCYFKATTTDRERAGVVIGKCFGKLAFDVRGDDGEVYPNITDVRLDHESVGAG